MTGTTYLASTALARAADALDAVNEHATLSGSGLCRTCLLLTSQVNGHRTAELIH